MPIFSPTDFAKEQVQAVQDYSLLAGRSISNLFAQPRYFGRHAVAGRPDRRRLAAHRGADRLLHRRGAGAADLQHAAAVRLAVADRPTGVALDGARTRPGADGLDGRRPQLQRHGQRTGLHEGDRADRRHARHGRRSIQEAGDAARDRQRWSCCSSSASSPTWWD